MSIFDGSFLTNELSKPTSILGLRLWVLIVIGLGAVNVLSLFLLCFCCAQRRRRSLPSSSYCPSHKPLSPSVSRETLEIVRHRSQPCAVVHIPGSEIQVYIGKEERPVVFSDHPFPPTPQPSSSTAYPKGRGGLPEIADLGWGHWYTLRELEEATGGFAKENVIGEGEFGIVYRGVLSNNNMVAIKNLLNNRGQAEKDFTLEVEAIGRIRHKNLVRLLGYCIEEDYRMLVYEFVDNFNLNQWLHGVVGDVSPLTWEIRMNIILGTAKCLAYLHEGLEPKVVHRDVKSSHILLDWQWNPKVADFGLAKLLCSEKSHVTTHVMGTFGYVAPEYFCTGMLNERSDVYSFGVLLMEILSGRTPVDSSRPKGEMNLVEWLKNMIGEQRSEEIVDPRMLEKPSSKALKWALLVALRCVDPEAPKRPKMSQVIHMLEMEDLVFH